MNRTLSSIPISVGTGLAIESLVQTPLARYSSILINIRTLFRNALSSFDDEDGFPTAEVVEDAVGEDMKGIAEALNAVSTSHPLTLIFYQPSYKGMRSMFPYAKLKGLEGDNLSPLQQKVELLRKEVTERILKKYDKAVTLTDVLLPQFAGKAIILTHHAVDLATATAYTRLNLLESHTGLIKTYPEFYTKLTGGKELKNIPLNALTLQVFGDRAVDFYSLPTRIKNEIKRLADETGWSSASTPSFCRRTINGLNGSPDKDILLKLIH